jgi:hypothetical protein
MTTSGFYLNKSIRSVTYTSNGKASDTGSLKRTQTTFRPKEGNFGDMEVRELPTYGINEKRTEITK